MNETRGDSEGRSARPHAAWTATDVTRVVQSTLQGWSGWSRFCEEIADYPEMQLYLAGGALRDALRGEGASVKDLDFFLEERHLDSLVQALAREGRIEYTIFGSPRWYPPGEEHMFCDLIGIERFHNGLGQCRDILDVLNQFDFTANALAWEVRSLRLFDPANGTRDLERSRMRAVRFDFPNEPVVPGCDLTRPQVLWFRLVHYTARLGLEIEPVTLEWLREQRTAFETKTRYEELFHVLHPEAGAVLTRYGLG